MKRSGGYIQQSSGYKAFIPSPLPPDPAIQFSRNLPKMLSEADRALARLDSLGDILPNVDLFIAMFVRKEAVLSSQRLPWRTCFNTRVDSHLRRSMMLMRL
jgi:hypothetical protein